LRHTLGRSGLEEKKRRRGFTRSTRRSRIGGEKISASRGRGADGLPASSRQNGSVYLGKREGGRTLRAKKSWKLLGGGERQLEECILVCGEGETLYGVTEGGKGADPGCRKNNHAEALAAERRLVRLGGCQVKYCSSTAEQALLKGKRRLRRNTVGQDLPIGRMVKEYSSKKRGRIRRDIAKERGSI